MSHRSPLETIQRWHGKFAYGQRVISFAFSFGSLCDTGCLKRYLNLDLNFFAQNLTKDKIQLLRLRSRTLSEYARILFYLYHSSDIEDKGPNVRIKFSNAAHIYKKKNVETKWNADMLLQLRNLCVPKNNINYFTIKCNWLIYLLMMCAYQITFFWKYFLIVRSIRIECLLK